MAAADHGRFEKCPVTASFVKGARDGSPRIVVPEVGSGHRKDQA